MQKKFDYDYSVEELQHWYEQCLVQLASRATRGILFFNNHVKAQAPRNAMLLFSLLKKQPAPEPTT